MLPLMLILVTVSLARLPALCLLACLPARLTTKLPTGRRRSDTIGQDTGEHRMESSVVVVVAAAAAAIVR